MPGMPFLTPADPYVQHQPQAAAPGGGAAVSNVSFFVWLFVLGVLLPALILGGLRAGGFQFVFKRRG